MAGQNADRLYTLTCPSCGAPLLADAGIKLTCEYCGVALIHKESEGDVPMLKMFAHGHALVVGVGADLPASVDDATAIADLLRNPTRCAYPPDQVRLFTGEQATAANILAALDALAQSTTRESTVIVYFSGHGLETPDYHLVPHSYDLAGLSGTVIPGVAFTERLRAVKARKLVIFDCCHDSQWMEIKVERKASSPSSEREPGSGLSHGLLATIRRVFRRKTAGQTPEPGVRSPLPPSIAAELEQGSGWVVIASSLKGEVSLPGRPYSVFTTALLEGLSGVGSSERDGYVRVLDLIRYIERTVPNRSGGRQHPIVKVSNLEDNFALAYCTADRKKPGLPDEAGSVPIVSADPEATQIATWRRMLTRRREALTLIEERMSEFLESQEIPLQLIDNKRRTGDQIADLERKLGLRT